MEMGAGQINAACRACWAIGRAHQVFERSLLPALIKVSASWPCLRVPRKTGCVALNYGCRNEIIHAIRTMIRKDIPLEEINEESFAAHLTTRDIPEPDLVIRTSGETRLSNFLIWETAYSEFWFTSTFWPDSTQEHLDQTINDYSGGQRRSGTVSVVSSTDGNTV
jgi:undecaprenyl diphosphate synthase